MANISQADTLVAKRLWESRVAELQTARRRARRLARMLARDPGGRLAERALDLAERLSLIERTTVDMLVLVQLNHKAALPSGDSK